MCLYTSHLHAWKFSKLHLEILYSHSSPVPLLTVVNSGKHMLQYALCKGILINDIATNILFIVIKPSTFIYHNYEIIENLYLSYLIINDPLAPNLLIAINTLVDVNSKWRVVLKNLPLTFLSCNNSWYVFDQFMLNRISWTADNKH